MQDWAYKEPAPTAEGAALGFTDVRWVEVLPAAYYDPTGTAYSGNTVPALSALGAGHRYTRAGQSARVPVTFRVAGGGAGKPVRVSLGSSGAGSLFATANGGTAGLAVELVTDANGDVTVWVTPAARERAELTLHALSGRGTHAVELRLTAADSDADGVSDALETLFAGSTTALAYTPGTPAPVGFSIF